VVFVRFLFSLMIIAACAWPVKLLAATTVVAETVAVNLVNRLVQNAATVVVSAPLVTTGANQAGLVNNTNFGSIQVAPAPAAVTPVVTGATGIMLTTGNISGTGGNLATTGDTDVFNELSAHPGFTTSGTFDASSVQFDFIVTPGQTAITFDLVFASNEAIAAVNPDTAVVMVDGVNYAKLLNGLLLSNQSAGILFAAPGIVTGFASASQVQTLTVVLNPAVTLHRIKIAIADNVDGLVDSAIIASNFNSTISTQGGMGVGDIFPPVITPAANVAIEATGLLSAVNLGAPTVTDNVDLNPRATSAPAGPYPVGLTVVTWTSTDVALNVGTATQTVTVSDTTPPVLTVPVNTTFAATTLSGLPATDVTLATLLGSATATDAVGMASITNDAPAVFPVGTTTVTYTARDVSGLQTTASLNIIITAFVPAGGVVIPAGTDQIPPVLKLVGNGEETVLQAAAVLTLYVDAGATVIDNFDGATPGVIPATTTIDTFVLGTYTLVYTATDLAGNAASIARIVHVVAPIPGGDVLPPVVTAPADVFVPALTFDGVPITDASLTLFFAGVTAVDNVAMAGAITNDAPATLPVGKTTITFTAMDAAGNRGMATAVISVSGTRQNTGSLVDLDGDLIPDGWEISIFGNLITAGPATDFDLDGVTDALERILGTNPKLANTNVSGASTDAKDLVYLINPSDSDGDGVVDALEDNISALDASVVTGIPSASGATTFSINGNGNAIQSVAVDLAAASPASVNTQLGALSYKVLAAVGATVTVRINSTQPFGTNGQFYKLDAVGNYISIPAANVTMVGANTIDLTLTDGGAMDLDGIANGVIVDPITFGNTPSVLGANGGASGGGCVIQPAGQFDPLFPLLFAMAALFWGLRRHRVVVQQGTSSHG